MDNLQRATLEREFDEKSARLSEMMAQMSDMQKAYAELEAAIRARIVKHAENTAKEETAEMERMLARYQQAKAMLNAANHTGDKAHIASAQLACNEEHLAFDLAERRMQDACRRYQIEIIRQGFADESAYQSAFRTKPMQEKLEATVTPFRMEYAALLTRCEEIESLLSEE